MLSEKDLNQIAQKGITEQQLQNQLSFFAKGADFVTLLKAATKPDYIITLDAVGDEKAPGNAKIESFIPASGAATRMFKNLFNILGGATLDDSGEKFFENISTFAFFDALSVAVAKDGEDISRLLEKKQYIKVLEYLLTDKGLNYGNTPKALLLFHKEYNRAKFAFEEHIAEAINYSDNSDVFLHYTLSPEHIDDFNKAKDQILPYYEQQYGRSIHIDISIQSPSTDTVAVNIDNTPFRNADGTLLFRPAGHGALIHNLNDIDADIIMIKNIDNVVPDSKKRVIIEYRKKLMNYLLNIYNMRNALIKAIDEAAGMGEDKATVLLHIVEQYMSDIKIIPPYRYSHLTPFEKLKELRSMLDRPMRVCGMVKNEGEPGGGPFVVDGSEKASLQIVESSQVNHKNPQQEAIFKSSTHFNPVDIVCMIKDAYGKRYNLVDYVDANTAFISEKSKDGKPLKALELPGLWNGAMADWITVFAEVPVETFNPVKTVTDLLRSAHIA